MIKPNLPESHAGKILRIELRPPRALYTMKHDVALIWFRRDLRIVDNPALTAALQSAKTVVPVFVWAPEEEGQFQPGRTSRWWSKQTVLDFENQVAALGSRLVVRQAKDRRSALLKLVEESGASAVYFNNLYDPISLVGLALGPPRCALRSCNSPSRTGERPRNQAGSLGQEGRVPQLQLGDALRAVGGRRQGRAAMHDVRGLLEQVGHGHACNTQRIHAWDPHRSRARRAG